MFCKLEQVFAKMNVPYFRQGSLASIKDYPGSFFTFWNMASNEESFFDNEAHKVVWMYNICYYTNKPETLYSTMDEFISQAREFGFNIFGRGTDIPSDTPTHPGRMIQIAYVQEL